MESAADHLSRDPHTVDFRHVGAPLPECLCVELGSSLQEVVENLRVHGFDQAPVCVPSSPIGWRLVAREKLEQLASEGLTLTEEEQHYQPGDVLDVESSYIPLRTLFGRLGQSRAVIACFCEEVRVVKGGSAKNLMENIAAGDLSDLEIVRVDAGSRRATDVAIYGLITISDLNRREVRKAAYELVLDLEDALARLVKGRFREPWDWINHVDEWAQMRILGQWELTKRRGMEINPVEAAMLKELLAVIRDSSVLRKALEFPTGKEFTAISRKVVEFRNLVMHPTRPLVLGPTDVIRANEAIVFMEDTVKRLESVLAG
jgi:hypothetical protein